jgi:hypothetical protein
LSPSRCFELLLLMVFFYKYVCILDLPDRLRRPIDFL